MINCLIILAVFEGILWNFCNSADLFDIEVNKNTAKSVPYLNGRITVFKHKTEQRYFTAPLAILRQETAESTFNMLNNEQEMRFYIEMFSDEAQTVVFEYLKDKHPNITVDSIELLPTEEIRLLWNDRFGGLTDDYTLGSNWESNSGLERRRQFAFSCTSKKVCDNLAKLMKNRPDDFHQLRLEFALNGQKSRAKTLTVTGEVLSQGYCNYCSFHLTFSKKNILSQKQIKN